MLLMHKLVFVAQTGAAAVLYILLALSVYSVGIVIERWWYFRKRRLDMIATSNALAKRLRAGDVAGAKRELEEMRAVEAAKSYATPWNTTPTVPIPCRRSCRRAFANAARSSRAACSFSAPWAATHPSSVCSAPCSASSRPSRNWAQRRPTWRPLRGSGRHGQRDERHRRGTHRHCRRHLGRHSSGHRLQPVPEEVQRHRGELGCPCQSGFGGHEVDEESEEFAQGVSSRTR
jgi:hypothetical protein